MKTSSSNLNWDGLCNLEAAGYCCWVAVKALGWGTLCGTVLWLYVKPQRSDNFLS